MAFIRTHYLEHEFYDAVLRVHPNLSRVAIAELEYQLDIEPSKAGTKDLYKVSDLELILQEIPKHSLVERNGLMELAPYSGVSNG